jgi:hypothetical protein
VVRVRESDHAGVIGIVEALWGIWPTGVIIIEEPRFTADLQRIETAMRENANAIHLPDLRAGHVVD